MRILLDANLLIGAFVRGDHPLFRAAREGTCRLYVCPYVIAETRRMLQRAFPRQAASLDDFLAAQPLSRVADASPDSLAAWSGFVSDPADVPVLAAAAEGGLDGVATSDRAFRADARATLALAGDPVRVLSVREALAAVGRGTPVTRGNAGMAATGQEASGEAAPVGSGAAASEPMEPDEESSTAGAAPRAGSSPAARDRARRLPAPPGPPPGKERAGSLHPLLDRRLPADGKIVFERRMRLDRDSIVADHRIVDTPVMPGAGFLEMVLAAARAWRPDLPVELRGVTLTSPLRLQSGVEAVVQVAIEPAAEGLPDDQFRIHSRSRSETRDGAGPDDASAPVQHCAGSLEPAVPGNLGALDLGRLAAALPVHATREEIYRRYRRMGLHYGRSFRTLHWLRTDGKAVVGRIEIPAAARSAHGFVAHPVLLDGGLQAVGGMFHLAGLCAVDLYVPVGVERLVIYGPLPSDLFVYGLLLPPLPTDRPVGRILRASFRLVDRDGRTLASLEGISFRRVPVRRPAHLPGEAPGAAAGGDA